MTNYRGIQRFFPGLFQLFYPCMNLILISKSALEKGEFLTAKTFVNLAFGLMTGYARGLLKDSTVGYLDKHMISHIQNVWKDDFMNFVLKECAVIPVTVLSGVLETWVKLFFVAALWNDLKWVVSGCKDPKLKQD